MATKSISKTKTVKKETKAIAEVKKNTRTKLTDAQKQKIIADYIDNQNYCETARMNNITETSCRRIIKNENNQELKNKVEQKKEENTKTMLELVSKTSEKRMLAMDKIMDAILDKADKVDAFTNIKDLSTAYGTLVDKEFKFAELKKEEKEQEQQKVFIPAKDIGKAFVDVNRWIDDHKYLEYWLRGGRGSIKSSFWSEKVTELLENNPNMCAILIRKVGNTIKDSVFAQMQWGIDKMGETYPEIPLKWKATKSPFEFKNRQTGQIIYTRGADDPGKIKSIKPPKGMYIGIIVYEEFDQMNGMNEVRKIDQSLVRGGNLFFIFRVYNTPKSTNHFVNKESKIPKPNRLVHTSDYRDVPVEFLGQTFIDEAEYVKEHNQKIWENEYLGIETGDGGNVFENVELREITDKEIENFDYLYRGLDFGWYPDPLAYTKMCYRPSERTLYIFDEFKANKMSNIDVWNYLKEHKGVTEDDMITADSAEEKSIGDFKSYGSFMRGAIKGPGSVDYSMKWLASLVKIVIDPVRCPNTAEEFTTYEYQQDKDGNYISGYVDANNHFIDSTRYAMNPVWKRKGE